jgi:hypothetical protein
MDAFYKTSLWQQFGAAIDMLANAINACPDELWQEPLWTTPNEPTGYSEFWYLTFHTLFWLDFYLSGAVEGFAPPAPFTLDELDPAGLLPERPYTKAELQSYLRHCRQKCHDTIHALTMASANRLCPFPWGEINFFELLIYNLRHVQEHAAQMNLFLGQKGVPVISWVGKAKGNGEQSLS